VPCSTLQCIVAVRCSALQCITVRCSALQCAAVRCSALQCVAVCSSVPQCAAVCSSVLPLHKDTPLLVLRQYTPYPLAPICTHQVLRCFRPFCTLAPIQLVIVSPAYMCARVCICICVCMCVCTFMCW